MGRICILKEHADELRNRLMSGELSVEEMYNLDSPMRQAKLREFLPEAAAKQVNSDFESKLILKNQQRGLQNWLNKQVDMTPAAKRDMLSKVQRMDKILGQDNGDEFLADLAETKLGARVTVEQANKLSELSKRAQELESLKGTDRRLEYGEAVIDFDNYLDSIKNPTNEMDLGGTFKAWKKNIKNPFDVISGVGGLAKSLKSAYDNSVLARQGFKTLLTSPKTWGRNAKQSFSDFWNTAIKKGQNPLDIVRADITSRSNTGYYEKMKLALGIDEFIPTTIQEKIPVVGRGFKASDNAFKGFLFRSRADLADIYLSKAVDAGVDIDDPDFLRGLGNYVNQQTGRGNLGKLEPMGQFLNNFLFSPRFLASHIETFTHALTGGQGISKMFQTGNKGQDFVRKQASIQLAKIAAVVGAFSALNKAFGDDGNIDPRGTKFGKIKVGAGYNDVTGGLAPFVTFMSRIITGTSINSSGNKTDLTSDKFGAEDREKVLMRYIRGKLAPLAGTIYSLSFGKGKDPVGNDMTPLRTVGSIAAPIPVTSAIEILNKDNPEEYLGSQLLDILGSASSIYNK